MIRETAAPVAGLRPVRGYNPPRFPNEAAPLAESLQALLWAHVVAGFIGLVAFWFPVLSRKGGTTHVRFGIVFYWCAYVVTLTALAVSLGRILLYWSDGIALAERPELYGFAVLLAYLGVVTFVIVRHGRRVIATRPAPETLRRPLDWALAWAPIAGSVVIIAFALAAWSEVSPILLGVSPIGLFTGAGTLRAVRTQDREPRGWLYSHLGSMLGGGIAFHTAFAVFGAQQAFNYSLSGPFATVPWLAPTLLGVPAIVLWTRHYRRRFSPKRAAT